MKIESPIDVHVCVCTDVLHVVETLLPSCEKKASHLNRSLYFRRETWFKVGVKLDFC